MKSNTQPKPSSRMEAVRRSLEGGNIETLPIQEGLRYVSPDQLVENPENERKTFRNMEGLIASIRKDGIQEPIIVEPIPGKKELLIVIGARRFRSAQKLNFKEIPVIVREARTAATRRRQSIVSNVQRENVGPVEMAEGLQALLDEDTTIKTQRQLAETIGKDEPWVSGMLKVLTIPSHLQRKLGTSQLSIPYDAAIKIARLKDPKAQSQMVQALLDGASIREIRERINTHKGRNPEPKASSKKVVYHHQNIDTILQGKTKKPTLDEQEAALKSALKEVRLKHR